MPIWVEEAGMKVMMNGSFNDHSDWENGHIMQQSGFGKYFYEIKLSNSDGLCNK